MKKVSTIILLMTAWMVCSSFFFANTVSIQVEASADDATQNSSNAVSLSIVVSPIANFNAPTNSRWGGARFLNVDIPRGARIIAATMVTSDTAGSTVIDATLFAEASDNAATFTTAASSISNRTRTSASVEWDVANTNLGNNISPDVSSLIQEVVLRNGWTPNNAIVIIASINSSSSTSSMISFNGNPTKAATLNVTYTRRRVWSTVF